MPLVNWYDVDNVRVATNAFWIIVRIPTTKREWPDGVLMRTTLNLPKLRGDEIAISTRQRCNMTISRTIPMRAFLKVFMVAAMLVGHRVPLPQPHVNLHKYEFVSIHGVHEFAELATPLALMMWMWDVPPQK